MWMLMRIACGESMEAAVYPAGKAATLKHVECLQHR